MATVSKPNFAAYWTPRWPRPPSPRIATTSPGRATLWRRALYVVTPAHISGAASTADSSSGIAASASAGTTTASAYPPGYATPGTWSAGQSTKLPERHTAQVPHEPPNQPTPTRWPSRQVDTPSPSASIRPAISCPGTAGNTVPGSQPLASTASVWHIPQASTVTRTWPGPGSGSSRLTISNGPPAAETSVTRMLKVGSSPCATGTAAAETAYPGIDTTQLIRERTVRTFSNVRARRSAGTTAGDRSADRKKGYSGRTERSSTLATSTTSACPGATPLTPSESIVRQNGQPTATVPAPVATASSTRSTLIRLPIRSSIHIRAPPAPQQKERSELRGISVIFPGLRPLASAAPRTSRGGVKTRVCRPR